MDYIVLELERLWLNQSRLCVLNLGCGTGMLDKLLIAKVWKASGVDVSEEIYYIAKNKIKDASVFLTT